MRKAYTIGINYNAAPENALNGCINDAKNIAEFLRCKKYSVEMATDEKPIERKPSLFHLLFPCCAQVIVEDWAQPTTRTAIIDSIKRTLANNCTIVISYSGHGTQVFDQSGEEADGKDECICAWDGNITDDELRELFDGFTGTCFFLMDCCHSGTLFDLPYILNPDNMEVHGKGDLPFKLITLSGCMDNQTSADASNVAGITGNTGALTACFLAIIKTLPASSDMRVLAYQVYRRLKIAGFSQICQLAASQKELFDLPITTFF